MGIVIKLAMGILMLVVIMIAALPIGASRVTVTPTTVRSNATTVPSTNP
jgi:hypothetical protein